MATTDQMANQLLTMLYSAISPPDYDEFLATQPNEEIKAMNDSVQKHIGKYIEFTQSKQKKAFEEQAAKILATFSDDPILGNALSRMILGDFDKSKIVKMDLNVIFKCEDKSCSATESAPQASCFSGTLPKQIPTGQENMSQWYVE